MEAVWTDDPDTLRRADKVIFPGVGEASSAMHYLRAQGLDQVLRQLQQPVLGICLGMQLFCRHSEENNTDCLGIFDTTVRKFSYQLAVNSYQSAVNSQQLAVSSQQLAVNSEQLCEPRTPNPEPPNLQTLNPEPPNRRTFGLKVPHMGWNALSSMQGPLFDGLDDQSFVYFVHSFYAELCPLTAAIAEYGLPFSAALQRDNFYGVQFHPEKSGATGSRILHNFLNF
ncbi:MAG: imidazole glycerol phosphate synthase subunit HisH [Chitinophagales bacterium]|nr:imidazole glycerol phosphate synthase subunit HisH [Chitinophagales bacterium]